MSQITSITSESLQEKIRQLLPSQQGFGEDLQASNVIVPTIDLTAAAEGAEVPEILQTAWDDATGHTRQSASTTTSDIITTTGFWQIDLVAVWQPNGSNVPAITVQIDDGTVTKIPVWQCSYANTGASTSIASAEQRFVVFLRAGRKLQIYTASTNAVIDIWYRQIADVNGTLTNPLGFSPQ